jgi:hypothetical protein
MRYNTHFEVKMNLTKILVVWKTVWDASTKMNPFPVVLDDALDKIGYSIIDLHTALAIIASKRETLTKPEAKLLRFWARAKAVQEAALVDATTARNNLPGSIFILKTKHGYTETNRVEQTSNTKVVMDWGTI